MSTVRLSVKTLRSALLHANDTAEAGIGAYPLTMRVFLQFSGCVGKRHALQGTCLARNMPLLHVQ